MYEHYSSSPEHTIKNPLDWREKIHLWGHRKELTMEVKQNRKKTEEEGGEEDANILSNIGLSSQSEDRDH